MTERVAAGDRVVIVGGGLTGLSAAHRIAERAKAERRAIEIVVMEAKNRVGGAIWTDRRDGFTLEGGADSFITNKPQGVELCKALGLGGQIIGTDTHHRRSFVVRRGRLMPVPEGFVLMAPGKIGSILTTPILSWRGKLRVLMDLFLPRKADDTDESLASFARRRLGREAFDRLIQPLVSGIYTADPADLSLKATLPQFPAMERSHRSLILAARRQARGSDRAASGARYGLFATLADGMETLPRALAASLPAGTVRTEAAVRRIARAEPGGLWRVERLDAPPIEARGVLLTTEAHVSARLVDGIDPDLALRLRSIPYASSVVVQLGYNRDRVAHPLDGFGAVVPAIEDRPLLAVSFTSVKFPGRAPAGTVLLRAFIGGATRPDLFERDDEAIVGLVRRELAELIGASGEPLLIKVDRHPRGMPQYTLGHLDRVAEVRRLAARHPSLHLAGNAFDGVGIPDCIRSGYDAADAFLATLAGRSATAAA